MCPPLAGTRPWPCALTEQAVCPAICPAAPSRTRNPTPTASPISALPAGPDPFLYPSPYQCPLPLPLPLTLTLTARP